MSIGPHTQGWSTTLTTPTVDDAANNAYSDLQDKARDIGERFAVEHLLNDSTTTDGQHLLGSARAGIGATATRPPNRTSTSQNGPTSSSSGGNETGRLHYDSTRHNLAISDGSTWLDLLPTGIIVAWSGSAAAIPSGWYLCDGANGTPDLGGRFIVGYDAGDSDYSTVGNTGGAKTVTLATTNLPSHSHSYTTYRSSTAGGGTSIDVWFESGQPADGGSYNTGSTGSGTAFDKRPPYYTLCYIMKR